MLHMARQLLFSFKQRSLPEAYDALPTDMYVRYGETRAVQECWDQVRLLQRLQFSKTDAPADKRTLNDDDVTQIQITECVVVRGAFKLDV